MNDWRCGEMEGWVSLPMYDWPETRRWLDRFWSRLRLGLVASTGTRPTATRSDSTWPTRLRHGMAAYDWQDAHMLLSQTCGFPYTHRLAGDVALLATPHYAVAGMSEGRYRSPVLCRRTDRRRDLAAFRDAIVAVNAGDSQSGCNALFDLVHRRRLREPGRPFFRRVLVTGSHRASMIAVATRQADLCAVDPVSHALARRHEPLAKRLRLSTYTVATPGLPLIAGRRSPLAASPTARSRLIDAWRDAIDVEARRELFMHDIVPIPEEIYHRVADRSAGYRLERRSG